MAIKLYFHLHGQSWAYFYTTEAEYVSVVLLPCEMVAISFLYLNDDVQ